MGMLTPGVMKSEIVESFSSPDKSEDGMNKIKHKSVKTQYKFLGKFQAYVLSIIRPHTFS